MYHMSANLAFGRREKIFGGTKSCRGKEAYKKNRKKSGDLFFFSFFFGDSKKFVGAAKNEQGGTKWQRYATAWCKSFMKRTKSIGPKIVPLGTPDRTGFAGDLTP